MSRKPFEITKEMRARVKNLAAVGMAEDDIGRIMGCPVETLCRRFHRELAQGPAEANAAAAGYLYMQAKAGNLAAIIFWLKTHGWVRAARKKAAEAARPPAGQPVHRGGTIIVPLNRSMDDVERIMPVWNEAVARCQKKRGKGKKPPR